MGRTALERIFQEMGFPKQRTWPQGAVVYSVARTYSLLIRELSKIYMRFGLSASSFNLLMLLRHGEHPESFTQQEAGSRLVVSPSDMTGLVDRLERKGLVKRIPGKDRRSKLLRITPKGSKLLDEVWPLHAEMMKRLAAPLSGQETQRLVQVLARVRDAVQA